MIGEVITLAGAVLVLLAAVGVVRFPDALSRMQSLTKASTVGVTLVAVGGVFVLSTWNDDTSAVAAALLQVLTLPVSASLLARSTYRATHPGPPDAAPPPPPPARRSRPT